jgi:phosphatidate cytidylyltransferase
MDRIKARVITSVFFVLIMLISILAGPYSFLALFGIINLVCLVEFFGLLLPTKGWSAITRIIIGLLIASLPYFITAGLYLGLLDDQNLLVLDIIIIVLPSFFLLFLFELYTGDDQPFLFLAYMVMGFFYIGLPFCLLIPMAFPEQSYFFDIILGVILYNWAHDTSAYFIGSKLGKTPLLPRISPKKTWEGTLGGILITTLLSIPMSFLFLSLPFLQWLGIAIIVGVMSNLGDLVESMLKRSVHIKDTSQILPGHGGLMDRFDALIFSTPFLVVYLYLSGSINVLF